MSEKKCYVIFAISMKRGARTIRSPRWGCRPGVNTPAWSRHGVTGRVQANDRYRCRAEDATRNISAQAALGTEVGNTESDCVERTLINGGQGLLVIGEDTVASLTAARSPRRRLSQPVRRIV